MSVEHNGAALRPSLIVLAIGLTIWFAPIPNGLDPIAWKLFAIFIATITAIILKPLPMGAIAVLSITTATITQCVTIDQALASFSSKTIWLILIAFLLARGFIKTGLGSRIAYQFVYFLGKSTLGLAYGLVLTEFLLSPFIPSNTARGAGIISPLAMSLSKEFKSTPEDGTSHKMGKFLMLCCFNANLITSAMFLTAMAANPIIASIAEKMGITITWLLWAKAAIVPGLLSLLIMPLVIYKIAPPSIKKTKDAKSFALKKLKKMGDITKHEKIMLGTFAILLTLWVIGDSFGVNATTAAFLGLSILLTTGVLTWDDILSEKNGWNTFIWLTTLLMLTNNLTALGMVDWFSIFMVKVVSGMSWSLATLILVLIYYYSHYLFASLTAHITSMFAAFATVAITAGCPPTLAILLFGFFSNLCATTTHYGTGTAPVYFGANYVSLSEWWKIGGVLSVVYLITFGGFGIYWLKFLNIW